MFCFEARYRFVPSRGKPNFVFSSLLLSSSKPKLFLPARFSRTRKGQPGVRGTTAGSLPCCLFFFRFLRDISCRTRKRKKYFPKNRGETNDRSESRSSGERQRAGRRQVTSTSVGSPASTSTLQSTCSSASTLQSTGSSASTSTSVGSHGLPSATTQWRRRPDDHGSPSSIRIPTFPFPIERDL